jgi:hypothetical protein
MQNRGHNRHTGTKTLPLTPLAIRAIIHPRHDNLKDPMKFSEWLRTHTHHSPITTEVAHKWNQLTGAERKGRISAARLFRVLGPQGVTLAEAELVMAAFENYKSTLPVQEVPQDQPTA